MNNNQFDNNQFNNNDYNQPPKKKNGLLIGIIVISIFVVFGIISTTTITILNKIEKETIHNEKQELDSIDRKNKYKLEEYKIKSNIDDFAYTNFKILDFKKFKSNEFDTTLVTQPLLMNKTIVQGAYDETGGFMQDFVKKEKEVAISTHVDETGTISKISFSYNNKNKESVTEITTLMNKIITPTYTDQLLEVANKRITNNDAKISEFKKDVIFGDGYIDEEFTILILTVVNKK